MGPSGHRGGEELNVSETVEGVKNHDLDSELEGLCDH